MRLAIVLLLLSGCSKYQMQTPQPGPTVTITPLPAPTVTVTPSPTVTPAPSSTPSPHEFLGHGGVLFPYLVSKPADVNHIGDYPSAVFELTQDIDMSGTVTHPIPKFSGTLLGHNYVISHMSISEEGNAAFITLLDLRGSLSALMLSELSVTSLNDHAAGFVTTVSGMLGDCSITSGSITSPKGGNGVTTGVGNPIYTYFTDTAAVGGNQATISFNGNPVNHSF